MPEQEVENRPERKFLTRLFVKTAVVGAFLTCLLLARVDIEQGMAFFASAFVGTFNWFGLALLLIGFTEKNNKKLFLGLGLKCFALAAFFLLVLPQFLSNIPVLMIGFSFFLIIAFIEALGFVLHQYLQGNKSSRPLPEFSLTKKRNAHDA